MRDVRWQQSVAGRVLAIYLIVLLVFLLNPDPPQASGINDAVAHFVGFTAVGILGGLWMGQRYEFRGGLLLVVVLAIVTELLQGLIPTRQTDVLDVVANLGGGLVGLVLVEQVHARFRPTTVREA